MRRNQTARQHDFAIIPKTDVPRSRFRMPQTRKQAFNASELVPVMCEEVLPGDTWQHTESIAARLATPIAPIVDDMDLETWYFFVPNRITWEGNTQRNRWEDFITGTSSTTIPTILPRNDANNADVIKIGSVFDHFGLPPASYSTNIFLNVLPIWAYFEIYNEWFRDENLQAEWEWSMTWTSSASVLITQASNPWNQMPLRVNKRSDYFTRSLPWPQKGDAVTIPLGTVAPVFTTGTTGDSFKVGSSAGSITDSRQIDTSGAIGVLTALTGTTNSLFADLSEATASTLNSLRLAIATQQLLEKDARGGTRYVENLLVHFGVRSPDYRLDRPEYLGGSKIPVTINPIAQTAAYDAEPGLTDSPVGNLGAEMHAQGHKRTFTYAATEHGYIIGLCAVRATPTYQQGVRRHWRRSTRLEFHWPTLANLGEQAVTTKEIFQPTNDAPSNETWGYQERGAEYRYTPNEITGHLRSASATPMDWWHLSEEFATEPALNAAFITDKTQETLGRALAVAPNEQWSAQIIMDIQHESVVARLMPAYSVPGLNKF